MTHIDTDNPIIRYYVWMYDLMWQYWYVWLLLCIIAVWIISKHFTKRQREWDEMMERMNRDRYSKTYSSYLSQMPKTNRDLYEKDVIEVDLKKVKPIK